MKTKGSFFFLMLLFLGLSCSSSSDSLSSDIPQDIAEVPRVTPENLKSRLDKGETIFIVDVRSEQAFNENHIPGAVHIPYSEVISRLDEFPKDHDIVCYCT